MKPYSDLELIDQITADRNWRLKEISDLKNAIRSADANLRRVLLRALVTICYAHWEGYVRFSARKYLEHISLRKLKYNELDRQFLRNYFLPRLTSQSLSNFSLKARCKLVDEIITSQESHFSRVNQDLVNTKSNLSFNVFCDICLICSVPIQQFLPKNTFIDLLLLKRRNAIAHGEDTLVGFADLDEIADETISLMRAFGAELENHAVLRSYRSNHTLF